MLEWFSFNTKKNQAPSLHNFSTIGIDIHSHILPGIDDGASDVNASIVLIKELISLGYHKLIATPHVMIDFYKNTPQTIKSSLNKLKKELVNQKINIEIEVGAEYYVDYYFEQLIESDGILHFGDNYVLIELSFMAKPHNLNDIIFKLQLKGYKVILAHPERYMYLTMQDFTELRDRNVYLQLNLLSLIDYYSKEVKKRASMLIESGFISFLGTDCHNINQASLYNKCLRTKEWDRIFDKNNILNHTL